MKKTVTDFNAIHESAKGNGGGMTFTILNKRVTLGARARGLALLFAGAALIMTGHFISVAAGGGEPEITVTRAAGAVYAVGAEDMPAADVGAAAGSAGEPGVEAAVGDGAGIGAAPVATVTDSAAAQQGAAAETPPSGSDAEIADATTPAGSAVSGDDLGGVSYLSEVAADAEGTIYVYVTGAVKEPGVYPLARSSMIVDAVGLAGGFTEQADVENVNLVFRLESNAMLNIKRKAAAGAAYGDSDDAEISGDGEAGVGGSGSSELYGTAVEIGYSYDGVLLTGDNAAPDEAGEGGGQPGARRVNINTAPQSELETLPGIGKSTAQKIIAYREAYKFARIEDLMNVAGIKQAKFDAIKDLISCS